MFTGRDGSLLSLKWVDFEFDEQPLSTHHYTSWCKYSITKNHKFCWIIFLAQYYLIKLLLKMLRISPLVTVINSCNDQISLAEMYRKKDDCQIQGQFCQNFPSNWKIHWIVTVIKMFIFTTELILVMIWHERWVISQNKNGMETPVFPWKDLLNAL